MGPPSMKSCEACGRWAFQRGTSSAFCRRSNPPALYLQTLRCNKSMNFSGIDNQSLGRSPLLEGNSERGESRAERAALRAAQEFEALFLTNLTAALNPSEDFDEDGLFSGAAASMYRQMFSEQIAKT